LVSSSTNNGRRRCDSDLGDNLLRQRLAVGDSLDQDGLVAPIQAIKYQHRYLRLARPVRLKLGAERDNQQHGQGEYPLDSEIEQLT